MGYVQSMRRVSPRFIVGVFAGLRVGIGVAFMIAPDRMRGSSETSSGDTLMTRSFAVREAVLGVGGLLAVAGRDDSLAALRTWAALGALTDIGDLGGSLAGAKESEQSVPVPALVATTGLLLELWALAAPSHVSTDSQVI
jgi:hypothetical protein